MKKSMVILPQLVCAALLTVNGSLGISIAIMGIFGLVRFQSAERPSSDIIHVFLAMVIGLVTSTGYLFTAIAITLTSIVTIRVTNFVIPSNDSTYTLRLTMSQDDDFETLLAPALKKHFTYAKLMHISMPDDEYLKITYHVIPHKNMQSKNMMHEFKAFNKKGAVSYMLYSQENTI
jgi:hypothetical protein